MLKNLIAEFFCKKKSRLTPDRIFEKTVKYYVNRKALSLRTFDTQNGAEKFWILITPWLNTAVPFFSFELGLSLMRSKLQAGFIYDLSKTNDTISSKRIDNEIIRLFRSTKNVLPSIFIKHQQQVANEKYTGDSKALKDYVFESFVKSQNSEIKALKLLKDKTLNFAQEKIRIRKLSKEIGSNKIKNLILPGGLFGVAGLYFIAAKSCKANIYTYDCGKNEITFCKNGIAAHFPNFKTAFIKAKKINRQSMQKIKSIALDCLNTRRLSKDEFKLQPKNKRQVKKQFDVLLLLNYRVDTAAMCQGRVFNNTTEWIHETSEFCAQNKIKIVIRQHPAEKIKEFQSKDDYSYLENKYNNLIYVPANSNLSTYDLIKKAKVVIPFTSRSGIEASLLGIRVLSHSKSFYDKLPFIVRAQSKSDYFKRIKNLLNSKNIKIPGFGVHLAYFLVEKCCFASTSITPIPESFNKWAYNEEKFDIDPGIKKIKSCLVENKNFIYECFKEKISG